MNITVSGAEVTIDNTQVLNLTAEVAVITEPPTTPTTTETEKQYNSIMLFKCENCVKLQIHDPYLLSTLENYIVPSSLTYSDKDYFIKTRKYMKDFVSF